MEDRKLPESKKLRPAGCLGAIMLFGGFGMSMSSITDNNYGLAIVFGVVGAVGFLLSMNEMSKDQGIK